MIIENGLFDRMVICVNEKNLTDLEFSGRCETSGNVLLTVRDKNGSIIKGFKNQNAGIAKNGLFKGILKGLKAGGPYNVEVSIQDKNNEIKEKKVVKNVLAGYVWIAAGQSNMQGCGLLKDAAKPHPMVRAFYTNDRWDIAKDPIHNLWECVDDVHVALGYVRGKRTNFITGTGPAVFFAQEMFRLTGIPQGVIACAHGGTKMLQWDPSLKHLKGKSLYGATLRRVKKNGGKVSGIIWYQGESDANENDEPLYVERMKKLVSSFRKDLKDKKLPFVCVQLGRFVGNGFVATYWNSIQDKQFKLVKMIKNFSVVPAVDLSLDDVIHISGRDHRILGKRLAYAMNVLINGKKAGYEPIAPGKISLKTIPPNNWVNVILEFKNVAKEFVVPEGIRPSGFSIGDPEPGPFIYDIEVNKNTVILKTNLSSSGIEGKLLYHGYGTDPYCNIRDTHGRLIPVFGPVWLGEYRALTPMFTEWFVSFPVEIPENVDPKLNGLKFEHFGGVSWEQMKFQGRFCDLHEKISLFGDKDFIILFSRKIRIPEPMKLLACFGYDGPVKLWVDEKEIFHDPEGTNPAYEDRAKVKFELDSGEHSITIALGSNKCRAWGIYFRIERIDVSKGLIKKGIVVPMPEII